MFNFPTTKDAGKNPRVVRVPRNFRGKDRHTKVTTMRGVRDRRIRLSAPIAFQLYDLQERLGLGQPSKVVDWLLEVARNSIDNLPPLAVSMAQPTSTTLDHHHHLRFCDQVTPNMLASYNNFNYTSIWDHPPSTLSLSRFGGGFSVMPQAYDEENNKSRSLTHATTSANMAASPSIFTPFFSLDGTESMEIDYEHSTRFNSFEF